MFKQAYLLGFVAQVKEILGIENRDKGKIKNNNKPNNLLQAWTKGEAHYKKVIAFLQEVSPTIGCAFINDKQQWQKFPNNIRYLAAFTRMCIDKEHIENKYSAPDYQRIYKNTFGITFADKPFKSIITKDFNGYLDAFVNMP